MSYTARKLILDLIEIAEEDEDVPMALVDGVRYPIDSVAVQRNEGCLVLNVTEPLIKEDR